MLRKLRKNYKRLVAFFLSAAMIISNVGGNVGTVFAAEEQEERESTIFMVDGQEILEAIQGLDGQEAFSKEDLEEMGLEVGRKGILKKYEKLLLPEKGKVYELALDINTELALEGTALQAFYNTETKEVIFLYLNESSQAVDFYVNIDGYETKQVTVEANDANAAAGQPEAEEGKEEPEKSAGGTSGGGAGSTGESANDGSKDASETSEEGSKEAESTSGESASENESSGEAAEESSKDDAPSAEQPEEKGSEDGSNDSDKASGEGSKADESKEESNEGSEAEDKGKDESEDKGQAEDGTDSVKEDGEKSDSDKKETEDSKQEDGNTDKESNDKGNAGKPNDTASDDGSSKESGEAKDESGDKADGKDEEKSEEDGSKKDDADKADQADGDSEGKGNAGSEGEKTSDDKSDDGSVKEDSADKADDQGAKEEGSADKGEDRSSDEGKSDSDGADSDSGDRHERNTLSLSMSIHQAAIVAIPADEIEGEAEPEEETTAVEEKEEEPEETTTAAEVTEEETEEKTTAPEVTEEETEEKTTAAAETEEVAEKETTTAAAETEETIKEETEAAQPEETTETEKATETEAEKESEATSEEATEAKTEEETKPEETTTEAAKAEGSGQGASDGAGNSSQEITDDWEIPGKAYDTVTIQETINARAYCVAIEDVKKIVEANQGTEAIETILAAAKTYTAETDDAEFTVGVPEGAFVEEVELRAVKIEDEVQLKEMADQAEGALEEGKTVSGIVAYDLSFVSLVSGEEVEPAKAVSVNIRMKEPVALSQEDQEEENAADGGVSVVHLPDEGEAEVVAEAGNGQETNFAFEAESFSDFVLVRTALKAGVESGALKAAIEKAISENGGVLVLDQDYEESALITINQDLTIDLNGHTLTYASEETAADKSFLTVAGANVTIQDGSGLGSIVSDAEKLDALICVQGKGTLTVEGGTFENRNGIRAITAKESSTVLMTGGYITDSGVLDTNGNVGSSGGGVLLIGSSFTMTGGSIEGNRGKLGGGVYATSSSTVDIKGSAKITENHAAVNGGGIYVRGGSSLIVGEEAVLSWNIADKEGGAVYGDAPCTVEVKEGESVTVEGNISGAGGKAVAGTGSFSGISDNQGTMGTGLKDLIGEAESGEIIVLTQNYIETESITIDKPIKVDLNGYTINYMGKNAPLFVVVGQEGDLVLQDGADGEAVALSGGTGEIVGRSEELDRLIEVKEGGTLTIAGGTLKSKGVRVVLSNNSNVTMTGGHIKESGIFSTESDGSNGGGMLLMNKSVFAMSGGSIEGNFGRLGGGIYVTDSQVTISGSAEISGNKVAQNGGGIYARGESTVTVSGGKISENKADDCGGGIGAVDTSSVTVSGGEISRNTARGAAEKGTISLGGVTYKKHYGGGGIFGEKNTTITLEESCLIDSNRSEATEPNGKRGGGYNGGGGIFSLGKIIMNGGTVSNNYAEDAGGGIYSAGWGSRFEMTDGTVSNNIAHKDEGGGLRIDCSGLITGGTFESNETHTTFDWGGGGIFVTTGGTLEITNLLVTGNTAEGFGGGVGGCSSGDVQIFTVKGAAIYGNEAHGTGLTQDRITKLDDHRFGTIGSPTKDGETFWGGNEYFQKVFKEESDYGNAYQDFYCAGKSTVYANRLGGGDAQWYGSFGWKENGSVSSRNVVISTTKDGGEPICTSDAWMALTANNKEAVEGNKVVVSGNTSTTHGGGIMSNGTLILGENKPMKASLKVQKNWSRGIDTSDLQVEVQLYQNGQKYEGTKEEPGNVILNSKEWSHEWKELPIGHVIKEGDIEEYQYYVYSVQELAVKKTVKKDDGTSEQIDVTSEYEISISKNGITLEPSSAPWVIGINNKLKKGLTVEKKWEGEIDPSDLQVEVQLYQDGKEYKGTEEEPGNVILHNKKWSHEWKEIPVGHIVNNNGIEEYQYYVYSVQETKVKKTVEKVDGTSEMVDITSDFEISIPKNGITLEPSDEPWAIEITNKLSRGLKIEKKWERGIDPSDLQVKVQLYQDGKEYKGTEEEPGNVTLNNKKWSYEWQELPIGHIVDNDGIEEYQYYVYSVQEMEVKRDDGTSEMVDVTSDYEVSIPKNGITLESLGEPCVIEITNKLKKGLKVEKKWESGIDPSDLQVEVQLYQDGKKYEGTEEEPGTVILNNKKWSYEWKELPVGHIVKEGDTEEYQYYVYSVQEMAVKKDNGILGLVDVTSDYEISIPKNGITLEPSNDLWAIEIYNKIPETTPETSPPETEPTTEPSTTPEETPEESTTPTETPEESTTPEETTPTETPQEPTTPEPTPSETPENPTTPSRPSGGGGRDRDRNPSVTPEPTPIPPEEVPLVNIDPENVPMAMMPSENPTETMVIDDESVPLFGLPKTGDRSASTGALLGVMLLSLMAACGIHMKKRKEEE